MAVMLFYILLIYSFFFHVKSNSNLHLIKDESSYLQKLPRYLSGIVISTLKVSSGGRAGWSTFPSFPGCAGLSSVFFCYFCYLPFEALSLALSSSSL